MAKAPSKTRTETSGPSRLADASEADCMGPPWRWVRFPWRAETIATVLLGGKAKSASSFPLPSCRGGGAADKVKRLLAEILTEHRQRASAGGGRLAWAAPAGARLVSPGCPRPRRARRVWDRVAPLDGDGPSPRDDRPALHVYLLGLVEFEAALRLQRQLVYHASGEEGQAALLLCEHPPLITVGRQGSHAHILCDAEELQVRRWPVRWVNRGGGCLLHLPGQLAIYPILPLKKLDLGLRDYLDRLHRVVVAVLDDFSVQARTRAGQAGVWVGDRPVAGVGVAVRDWVTWY